jgi:hypothetical protein
LRRRELEAKEARAPMAVNAARRPSRRPAASTPQATGGPVETLAIGEIDQTVFDCPNCARPLALGAHRCPGCGTRLAMGVPLSKASVFVVVGLMVGFLAGGGAGLLVGLSRPATVAQSTPVGVAPSVAPVASSISGSTGTIPFPSAVAVPSAAPTSGTGMPTSIQAALLQASTMNGRFATDGSGLAGILAAHPFDASAVAQTLRSISADSLYASQVAQRLSVWPDTQTIGGDLGTSYERIHEVAEDALVASVRNDAAYRAAARDMLTELAALRALEKQVAEIATANGVALPGGSAAP